MISEIICSPSECLSVCLEFVSEITDRRVFEVETKRKEGKIMAILIKGIIETNEINDVLISDLFIYTYIYFWI